MSTIKSTVLLCFVFISIVLVMFVISVIRVPQLSAEEMRSKGVFILPRPRDIAEFELRDHTGAAFDRANFEGRWSFVFFGFVSCPDVCPTSMAVLGTVDRQLQSGDSELADQFQGILVSVDPERDSLEALGAYATAFSPRFLGVTGSREDLVELTTQVNVAFAKVPLAEALTQEARSPEALADAYTLDHTGNIVIINPRGHYHGFIKLPHNPETIRLTYQTLAAQF
jgi:protein SCO1/2